MAPSRCSTGSSEQRIGAAVAALPPELALGSVAAQTTRLFAGRRVDASHTAEAALDSGRYLALLDVIDALLADPPLTPAAAAAAPVVLPAAVATAARRTRRALRAAHAQASGSERDEQLHEMRKAAKRLRYATEAVVPVRGRPAKQLVKQVKAVHLTWLKLLILKCAESLTCSCGGGIGGIGALS